MAPPEFMSQEHVDRMNAILTDAASVQASCSELDRPYTLAYELAAGPAGSTVHWTMSLDPDRGVAFALTPADDADLTLVGDWATMVRAAAAGRRGEVVDPGVTPRGDESIMEQIGPAFAAAQAVATVDVTFPDAAL